MDFICGKIVSRLAAFSCKIMRIFVVKKVSKILFIFLATFGRISKVVRRDGFFSIDDFLRFEFILVFGKDL